MNLEEQSRCKICGQPPEAMCHCRAKLAAAKSSFREMDTCQTCRHSISGIGSRGSTDRACDLADDWIVPSNGFCSQHINLEG